MRIVLPIRLRAAWANDDGVVGVEIPSRVAFARVAAIFYEVDDRWASAGEIERLLRAAGFTRFVKYGRGHHYDVLASRS